MRLKIVVSDVLGLSVSVEQEADDFHRFLYSSFLADKQREWWYTGVQVDAEGMEVDVRAMCDELRAVVVRHMSRFRRQPWEVPDEPVCVAPPPLPEDGEVPF